MNIQDRVWNTCGRFLTIALVYFTLQGMYLGYKSVWIVGLPLSFIACWIDTKEKKKQRGKRR